MTRPKPHRQDVFETGEKLRKLLLGAKFAEARECVMAIHFDELPQNENSASPDIFLEALQIRAMAAEVLDYWGDLRKARSVIAAPAAVCKNLLEKMISGERAAQLTDRERGLLRQRLWILLHAGMADYRSGELEKAKVLFDLCDTVCERHLITSSDQAWGTRARIQYSIALIHRECSDFEAARKAFNESVDNAYRSLESQDKKKLSMLTHVAIAKNLALGLAYVHSAVGRPDLAFPLLLAAKSILQPMGEVLTSAYVDLIYANTARGIGGDQPGVLDDVITRLRGCYETFHKHNHQLYMARAAYSLGLAYAQRARPDENESVPLREAGRKDLSEAWACTVDIQRHSDDSGDDRFGFYRHVLESRIHRKRDELDLAEESAGRVVKAARKTDGVYVDALLARGEARARKGDVAGAVSDFEEVSKTSNVRLRAVSFLNLARLHSHAGHDAQASQAMQEFEKIRPSVTHVQIKALELQARAAMEQRSGDLVLKLTDASLDVQQVEARVRRFMVAWARKNSGTDQEAAQKLGISRQTLYNWSGK